MTVTLTDPRLAPKNAGSSSDPTGDALLVLRRWKSTGVVLTRDHVSAAARMTGADPDALWSLILSHCPRKY